MESGVLRMPRQDVAEGQKHGYIGEDTGEVIVVDAPAPGDSNARPDAETAQARVNAARVALDRAEADLAAATKQDKDADKAEKVAAKSNDKAADKPADKARTKSADK